MRLRTVTTGRQSVPCPTGLRSVDQSRRFAPEAPAWGLRSLVGVWPSRGGHVAVWASQGPYPRLTYTKDPLVREGFTERSWTAGSADGVRSALRAFHARRVLRLPRQS